MFRTALHQFKIALILLVSLTLLTGLLYPMAVTGIAQLLFPKQANGSLIEKDGKVVGSLFIGQSFTDPKYFWGRPSATTPYPYNGESSSGSNLGPSNPAFIASVKDRITALRQIDSKKTPLIPVDLVTASGSGLDPEISPQAAYYQVSRIANLRHLPEKDVEQLVKSAIQPRTFCILGEPRVNVLQLNQALDNIRSSDVRESSKS